MGRSEGPAVSSADELLNAYRELHELAHKALASLKGGLDLEALTPIFERKERLNAQIRALGVPDAATSPALLQSLLEAQAQAAQAEAVLVQALQPFVPSNKTFYSGKGVPGELQTGKKWDLSG
jgi:hypothetical protein